MSTACRPVVGNSAKRFFSLFCLCLLLISLGACVKGKSKGGESNPNEKQLAYGLAMNVPPSWTIATTLPPESSSKDVLDARRKNGEPLLFFETVSAPSAKGSQSVISLVLVNEEGRFMPREYAEKLKPEEFEAIAKNMMEQDRALAKKKKIKHTLLDMNISRDTVGGNFALMHRLTVAGPDGRPVRLLGWDIYLPNGAGVMARTQGDPDAPGAEQEIMSIIRSLHAK